MKKKSIVYSYFFIKMNFSSYKLAKIYILYIFLLKMKTSPNKSHNFNWAFHKYL